MYINIQKQMKPPRQRISLCRLHTSNNRVGRDYKFPSTYRLVTRFFCRSQYSYIYISRLSIFMRTIFICYLVESLPTLISYGGVLCCLTTQQSVCVSVAGAM